jgi:hypothetical protein
MIVGMLHAGVDPADVLPAAAGAAGAMTAVEGTALEVVRGQPRLTVRFEASDDLAAAGVGRAVVARVDELVDVETSRVTRRFGARWYPMR